MPQSPAQETLLNWIDDRRLPSYEFATETGGKLPSSKTSGVAAAVVEQSPATKPGCCKRIITEYLCSRQETAQAPATTSRPTTLAAYQDQQQPRKVCKVKSFLAYTYYVSIYSSQITYISGTLVKCRSLLGYSSSTYHGAFVL